MADVLMPRLSDSMEEGTILKWLKSSGEQVSRGEELAEIETDKATMTYEADEDGVLEVVAEEGTTLPIGAVIARIGAEAPAADSPAPAPSEPEQPAEAPPDESPGDMEQGASEAATPATATAASRRAVPAPAAGGNGAGDGERVKASPVARRLAGEHGIELERLEGTGPGGRIVKADVEAAAGGGAAPEAAGTPVAPAAARSTDGGGTAKGEVETVELTRLQQVVARRMAESKATIPEFSLTTEVDMEGCVALRAQLKELGLEATPSYNDMVVKACGLALREFPRANGSYKDGGWELHARVNVGIAVAAQDALVVPTIFDVDVRSLGAIAKDARALAGKVRDGKITPPDLSGGTFTVSNLGMYGVTEFTAVINPPQAAILAVGAMGPQPVVRDGEVVVRNIMSITLVCDHRILYGADAAEFLARIRAILENPLLLSL